ncbi:MAG TPA: helix-turn-helix domain-containing protein [Bacteroidales bacterium]|nr:helix-turn-helix domain-containing protein [Bacteroidales bacterium]HRZ21167.1 helix-turn-helix domain-containing protein [Bacteroidales bacterium]
MKTKIIKTQAEYDQALQMLETIIDAKPGTPEGDELELLALLIDNYEKEHFPVDLPDPIEAIKLRMEQLGYTDCDLAKVLGSRSRVSEIMNRKRKLSISMIRRLNKDLHIPADVLIQDY